MSGISYWHYEMSAPGGLINAREGDYLALNKAIAYKGKIGQKRAEFSQDYMARKQAMFREIEKDLTDQTAARGEKITCQKGCFYCCSQYISGTLQEAEPIVYYLYQHEVELANFMQGYPAWREKIRGTSPLFDDFADIFNKLSVEGPTEDNLQSYQEITTRYLAQNIPCPFLSEGSCSIYEVRPWCCASVASTTPGEWCSPLTNEKPRVYTSYLRPKEVPFFRDTKDLTIVPVPLSVYEILKGGFTWLSAVPGLEGLEKEVVNDPAVRPILQRYR